MASKFLLALSLSLLVSAALGDRQYAPRETMAGRPLRLSRPQQCRIQRISAVQPRNQIQSEGGFTELWDEFEDQFQCAGVVAMRNTLRPNALSLPNYHPNPRLIYIERGQGFIGVIFPGCAETYQARGGQQEAQREGDERDLHQKIHRIRRGDVIALPPGAVHWCHNDGSEDLIAVSINDLNHQSNQLDQKFRAFYLAGSAPQRGKGGEESTFHNIFQAFDAELMAEAFNVSPDLIRRMQATEEERGLSVIARESMSYIRPDEYQRRESSRPYNNGFEETFCAMKIRTNIENAKDADIYSREAGKLNVADRHKLPILSYLDMSAEKGSLFANAMLSPHWAMEGHTIVYVTRGEAQVEVVDHSGQAMMKERVSQGDMFVVPQFYTSTAKAGNQGFEWVAFKTSGNPMRNDMAGYTSALRGMPLQVLTNAYQMSPSEAQAIKTNRGSQTFLLSPARRAGKPY
ncbi:11S globulin seed storage protein 2-like [Salvia miltiorrhiza]|uniref:11S globulin seed storage protein 2-like n=1 Tax=Salvia miltiorrhiza TaxID=226208 RepID=UPI0025AB70E1|nr:11S globulin seed storage protein 2-like [Salvia miltiorrhiza]